MKDIEDLVDSDESTDDSTAVLDLDDSLYMVVSILFVDDLVIVDAEWGKVFDMKDIIGIMFCFTEMMNIIREREILQYTFYSLIL